LTLHRLDTYVAVAAEPIEIVRCAMPGQRSYSAGKFALELDGVAVGFVLSAEGGEPFGPVIEDAPVGVLVRKHLGAPEYAPLVIEVGAVMEKPLFDWVAAMLDGTQTATDGAIAFLDYAMKEQLRLEWTAALITEVVFPAADAAAPKESGAVRVTLQPAHTVVVPGSGARYTAPSAAKTNKAFLPSNFRFTLSGLPSDKVAKVAPIVVGGTIVHDDTAGPGDAVSVGPLDVSDLVIWLPESAASPLTMWFDDFVIKGFNDSANERTASLTFVEPSLKNDLLSVEFGGVGIFRISHERHNDNASVVARVKVEMYCETVSLATPPAAVPPTPPLEPSTQTAVDSLAGALASALRERPGPGVPTSDAIAERLLASVGATSAVDERERGREVGKKWAGGHAQLDELEAIAPLAERDDWTALALAEGHSLVAFLAANGDVAADERGPIDLKRDEFTTGLVAGAAEVYRDVAPRLAERRGAKS
jgi:hypothetical protein